MNRPPKRRNLPRELRAGPPTVLLLLLVCAAVLCLAAAVYLLGSR